MAEYDLSFGNSVAVREALLETTNKKFQLFSNAQLLQYDYPPKEGDPRLIDITKQVLKRHTGQDYKYVLITNGATGGVVIALRSYANEGFGWCYTRNPPYYSRYPIMFKAAGLEHYYESNPYPSYSWKHVMLIDFPSNPLGLVTDMKRVKQTPAIVDGAYNGLVYNKLFVPTPQHEIYVGSYSKLLGLNGLRIGFIATNDEKRYNKMLELITGEYCGISQASSDIVVDITTDLDWDSFERNARRMLDDNREQFLKLKPYLNTEIPEVGMFWYGHMDQKCRQIMNNASIKWTSGLSLGTHEDMGRLNMGQNREFTKKAVDSFLKADKINRGDKNER